MSPLDARKPLFLKNFGVVTVRVAMVLGHSAAFDRFVACAFNGVLRMPCAAVARFSLPIFYGESMSVRRQWWRRMIRFIITGCGLLSVNGSSLR